MYRQRPASCIIRWADLFSKIISHLYDNHLIGVKVNIDYMKIRQMNVKILYNETTHILQIIWFITTSSDMSISTQYLQILNHIASPRSSITPLILMKNIFILVCSAICAEFGFGKNLKCQPWHLHGCAYWLADLFLYLTWIRWAIDNEENHLLD